ncbi:MAG: hypothetical protein L3J57_14645 [Desulfuromusa sp.]|nr:hypothetical protein [Desulfuromusa sp.]
MIYKTAYLSTEDDTFSEELNDAELEGVTVLTRITAAVQWDQIAQHLIEFSSERAIDLFIGWLVYKKAQKISKKTIINGVDVSAGPAELDRIAKDIKNKIKTETCGPDEH